MKNHKNRYKSLTSKVSREARAKAFEGAVRGAFEEVGQWKAKAAIIHVDCATKNAIIKELHRLLREKDEEIAHLRGALAHFPEALRAAAIDPICECGDKLSWHDACSVGVGSVPDCTCNGFKEKIET